MKDKNRRAMFAKKNGGVSSKRLVNDYKPKTNYNTYEQRMKVITDSLSNNPPTTDQAIEILSILRNNGGVWEVNYDNIMQSIDNELYWHGSYDTHGKDKLSDEKMLEIFDVINRRSMRGIKGTIN